MTRESTIAGLMRCALGVIFAALLLGACFSAEPQQPAAVATPAPLVQPSTTAPGHLLERRTPASAATPCSSCAGPVAAFDPELVGEASGLARSDRDDDLLWVLNDGPGTTAVLAVRTAGAGPVGLVPISGLKGVDTEALAGGPCATEDPRHCLFIGDIGDNTRARTSIFVHRIVEPDLSRGVPDEPVPADVAELTYPDGATDAEAMFVLDGRLFIVSKARFDAETRETGPTHLYEVPGMAAGEFRDGELIGRGVVPVPVPELAIAASLVGNVVTGADAVPGSVVLRTYDHAVRYTAADEQTDPATMGTWAFTETASSGPLQTEAISFDADDCATLTVGEGSGTVWRTPCR